MHESLEHELQSIGLSEKEAKVYLAALELGEATAQSIAAKAVVSRPNTYVMIESLGRRGLLSEVVRGSRRYFSPTAPEKLLQLISDQRQQVQEKENRIKGILPDLLRLTDAAASVPAVRQLAGTDIWTELQQDILDSGAVEVFDFSLAADLPTCLRGKSEKRILDKCRVRAVISGNAPVGAWAQARHQPDIRLSNQNGQLPFGAAAVYGDRVFLSAARPDGLNVILRDASVAAILTALFESVWSAARR